MGFWSILCSAKPVGAGWFVRVKSKLIFRFPDGSSGSVCFVFAVYSYDCVPENSISPPISPPFQIYFSFISVFHIHFNFLPSVFSLLGNAVAFHLLANLLINYFLLHIYLIDKSERASAVTRVHLFDQHQQTVTAFGTQIYIDAVLFQHPQLVRYFYSWRMKRQSHL